MSRPVIAWRGVVGWLLVLVGTVLGFSTSTPLNGATLVGCLLVASGGFFVGTVIAPRERDRHGR